MKKGHDLCWLLTLFGMAMILLGSFLALLPCFRNHPYAAVCFGELLLIVPILYGQKHLEKEYSPVSLGRLSFPPSLLLPLAFLPCCQQQFSALFLLPASGLLQSLMGELQPSIRAAESVGEFCAQFFSTCLLAPILEELLCHGVLIRLLRPYGKAASIGISALCFALLHFDLRQIPLIFLLGILIGLIRVETGSLGAAIYTHACNNFSSLLLILLGAHAGTSVVLGFVLLRMFGFLPLLWLTVRRMKQFGQNQTYQKSLPLRFPPAAAVCIGAVLLYNIWLIICNQL